MKKNILLIGKNGEYLVAEKNNQGNKLIPTSEKVFAREIVSYGFDFEFGGFNGKHYGIFGYGHEDYKEDIKEGKIKTKEDYAKINLDRTINGLEKDVEKAGADYVLIDGFYSRDNHTSWQISGRAQLFIKR